MSRKKSAPKKLNVVDPKYKSVIIPKLINSLMYDGKKTIAEKISILISVGSESKAKSELINIVADTEIETLLYKRELDYNFKSKDDCENYIERYKPFMDTFEGTGLQSFYLCRLTHLLTEFQKL